VAQLEPKPQFLYMYLDSLFDKDPQICLPFSDRMVELYAAYDVDRLMPFLRGSNFYDLEKAYRICKERDYVPEMVFLLGRMGNNKQALMLIIERLGDVQRVSHDDLGRSRVPSFNTSFSLGDCKSDPLLTLS
jgi:hypothetical protein